MRTPPTKPVQTIMSKLKKYWLTSDDQGMSLRTDAEHLLEDIVTSNDVVNRLARRIAEQDYIASHLRAFSSIFAPFDWEEHLTDSDRRMWTTRAYYHLIAIFEIEDK